MYTISSFSPILLFTVNMTKHQSLSFENVKSDPHSITWPLSVFWICTLNYPRTNPHFKLHNHDLSHVKIIKDSFVKSGRQSAKLNNDNQCTDECKMTKNAEDKHKSIETLDVDPSLRVDPIRYKKYKKSNKNHKTHKNNKKS